MTPPSRRRGLTQLTSHRNTRRCSAKNANCQTLVSVTLACGEVPVTVGLRLFLPESWTSDPLRLARTGIPVEYQAYRTKPQIALEEIDRVRAAADPPSDPTSHIASTLHDPASMPPMQSMNIEGKREIVGLHIESSEAETFWATFSRAWSTAVCAGPSLSSPMHTRG